MIEHEPIPTEPPPAPEKPWVGSDKWKSMVENLNENLDHWGSIFDVFFEAVKLAILMAAVVWVLLRNTAIPVFWIGLPYGAIISVWVAVKVIPHVSRIFVPEVVNSRREAVSYLRRTFLIILVISVVISTGFSVGMLAAIDQIPEIKFR